MERGRMAWVVLAGTVFGVLEACTVVYLRHLLDPAGNQFPFVPVPASLLRVEQLREAGTLLLLVAVAWLGGTSGLARWSAFLVAFGTWDLVYYAALRLLIGWPATLATWDLLFLLPVPWYGPVYAPILIATTMLACGLALGEAVRPPSRFPVRPRHVAGVGAGGALLVASFVLPGRSAVQADRYPQEALWVGLGLGLAGFGSAWVQAARARSRSSRGSDDEGRRIG